MKNIKLLFIQAFCNHWWKPLQAKTSPYFWNQNQEYLIREIHECKICGKTKILTPNK